MSFFFFQAEDGIRDVAVTGVQTCALPICVGFSGQMHGAVLIDERGNVVRPALIWCDVRTEKQCRELTRALGLERLIQLTSNPALPNFTLTKVLWVREKDRKSVV